jgi:phytanoyl-CoA hydroxylase
MLGFVSLRLTLIFSCLIFILKDFLESSEKAHFFTEPTALDKDGSSLLPEHQDNKMTALNKVGHALHLTPGAFSDYCQSAMVRDLVLDLGWQDPVVPQSMYIFKQALMGGVVNSHQDSTFLFTAPKQSCLGLWLALDDATLDNGCLWVRPKSHTETVRRQYKRNPLHFGTAVIESRKNEAEGDSSQPKFVMDDLYEHDRTWDGSLPEKEWKGLLEAGFVPVECKAGDLLAFCGELDHLSLQNCSDQPRHTFQLHLVEGPGASVTWSTSNWLQYPDGRPFLRLLGD